MALFNPQVQDTNTPDWTNVTRPTSQAESDKSKGIALSTIAGGLETGAKLAESTFQDYVKDKVSAGVDALRDTSIAAYANIRGAQVTGTQPAVEAVQTAGFGSKVGKPQSLLSADANLPEGLEAGLDKAENIGLAKTQRGGANDTLYTAALYSLTKQLRAEYPGHKDFIDEQIAKISGKNPANAFMANLMTDINHAATGQDTFQKQILTKAAANMGDAAVQKWYLAAQHGVPNAMSGLTNAVFKAETQKLEQQTWEFNNKKGAGDQAADATIAQGRYEERAQQVIDKHLNPVLDIPGLTSGTTMKKLIDDSMAGKITLTGTQKDQLLSSLVTAKSQALDELQSVADKEGYSSRIRDPKKVQAIRDDKAQYFDRTIDAISNNSYGTLHESRRRVEASQKGTEEQVMTSPLGEWFRRSKVMQDYLGPNWGNYIDSLGLQKGGMQQLQSYFNDSMVRATVPDDIRKDGVAASLYKDLDDARKARANGVKAPDKLYDNLVENVDLLNKASAEGKEDVAKQVVKYTFDPAKNSKIVEFFNKDFTDDKGVLHKGKFAVYDTLTRPKVVDSVFNLKDRDSWAMMKNWQEMSFKTLFGEEAANLNKLQEDKSVPLYIHWDSDAKQLRLESGKEGPFRTQEERRGLLDVRPTEMEAFTNQSQQNYIRFANETIHNLNKGLSNLAYMHGKEGSDTSAYLFQTLMTMGYSPNDRLRGNDLPQMVIEAIAASQKPKPSAGEAYKRAQ